MRTLNKIQLQSREKGTNKWNSSLTFDIINSNQKIELNLDGSKYTNLYYGASYKEAYDLLYSELYNAIDTLKILYNFKGKDFEIRIVYLDGNGCWWVNDVISNLK